MSRHAPIHAVLLLCLAWIVATPPGARAQQPAPDLRISVITVSPGDMLHSLFGHTALRVREPSGQDLVFNYGTFAFDETFLLRFVYGELDYHLSVASFEDTMALWRSEERSVSEQVLDLEPQQAFAVLAFLADNARPEQRTYRYDFLLDNCTTRVHEALRAALGQAVRLPPGPRAPATYRELIDPYLAGAPWIHLGIDLLMGMASVDRSPEGLQLLWLPDLLARGLDEWQLQAPSAEGAEEPLRPFVSATRSLHDTGRPHMPEASPDWAAIVLWALFALAIPFGGRRVLAAPLLLVVGAAGLLMLLLWSVSLHHVTDQNLNLLWAWPTHLVAGVLVARGRRPGWLLPYLRAAAVVTLLVALAWAFLPQRMPSAALPLALACGLGCLRLAARPRAVPGA